MFWLHSKHLLRLSMFRTIVHKYIVAFSIVCLKIISRVDYNPIMTGTKLSAVLKFHFWPSTRRYLQPRSETGFWKKYTQLNTAYRDLLTGLTNQSLYEFLCVCVSSSGQFSVLFVLSSHSLTRYPQRCVIIYKNIQHS